MLARPKQVIPELYQDPAVRRRREAVMLYEATAPKPSPSQGTQPPERVLFSAQPVQRTVTPYEYSPEVGGVYDKLKDATYSAPFTSEEIMGMPEYKALADVTKFNMDQAQAGLDRSFASRGMLRSTPMVQASNNSAAYYTARMNEQLLPLIQAAYARRQQDLANQRSLLGDARGMEDAAFSRGVTDYTLGRNAMESDRNYNRGVVESDRNFGIQESAVTGQYTPSQVASLLSAVLKAKESWGNENDGTTKAQDEASANAARQALQGYGFSSDYVNSLVGSGVTLEQAKANIGRFSAPTMQAKQVEANQFGTYGGKQTLQGQAAQHGLDQGALQLQIAQNPEYGLVAQAEQAMRQGEAQIANTQSITADRAKGGSGTFTPYQQYQIDTDLADREQKAYQTKVDSYTKTFDVTPAGAESWLALEEAITEAKGQGMDRQQAYTDLLGPLLNNMPALTAKDRAFLYLLFSASYGDQNAAGQLETLKRGYKAPEEDPLNQYLR